MANMELLILLLYVIPTTVISITVSSNGNSPEIKMLGGMMVDVQKGFVPMASTPVESTTKINYDKSRKLNNDKIDKLSLNERYRRLIPYMTFYYANDLASTTETYSSPDVEVEKAEIVEARTIEHRQPKKIVYSPQRNIPRYQGNRLTQFNIASANPVKVHYRDGVPVYYNAPKVTNYNPLIPEHPPYRNHDFDRGRFIQKPIVKSPSAPFTPSVRKPFQNLYNNDDSGNVQYYVTNKEQAPRYKLVPYHQTLVKPGQQQHGETIYEAKKPVAVPVFIPKDPIYIKPRPTLPQFTYDYDNLNIQQVSAKKIPAVVSESYYEKRRPVPALSHPVIPQNVIEDGFKPIVNPVATTEASVYTTAISTSHPHFESAKNSAVQVVETASVAPEVTDYKPNYYQYAVEQPTYTPEENGPAKTVTLSDLLNSLQLNKSIPKPITRDNVGSSIRTLLEVLNALKAISQQNELEGSLLSTPKPFIAPEEEVQMTPKSVTVDTPAAVDDVDLHEEPYLAQVNTPSQHLDDYPASPPGSTSQQFPPPVHADTEGGTPGRPGADYPVLTTIPQTSFDCKTQRYKGFFADPETRCQVWHYCDLNGGQASFLCPNGTIFSQAALTCDWWFNVRCATTTQLYVLNESLYKYILPHSPKFPEDYSGPLVDKYLTLKFKEMEEQFRKNKNKQSASEKIDSDDTEESTEEVNEDRGPTSDKNEAGDKSELTTVSEASVLVESPGTSGNVERLQE